ncbi:MAG: FAD-dependent oxidoreductase [Pseudomonadota bacterium]
MTHVLVAGAGIVGVSTAIWLQRAGFDVTVVDRAGPASATSFGNAGVLAAGAFVPVTVPGLMRKVPGMLWSRDEPLFLRWSYLPRLLPWLRKYLSYARADHVEHYAASMSHILADSYAQHKALSEGTGAEKFLSDDDYCFGYSTRAAFEADAKGWDVRKRHGVAFEVLEGEAYGAVDPVYGDHFEVVVRCKEHGRISDPGAYVRTLFDHFLASGGKFFKATIEDLVWQGESLRGLATNAGEISGDIVVLATGSWSKPLATKLGCDLPLEAERGYHIELVNPSEYPKNPMMVASAKAVITPMEGRIRMAGVVEFGGLTQDKSNAPIALLKRQIADILPGITYDRIDDWVGHRPALANSLPVIGASPRFSNAYLALGHQHVGLTGGPKSGRIIADLIAGRSPNIDLLPFDPDQYS